MVYKYAITVVGSAVTYVAGPGHGDYNVWCTDDRTAVCAAAMPFPVETRRNSTRHTVVINALCGCYSWCYFTFYGCGITSMWWQCGSCPGGTQQHMACL